MPQPHTHRVDLEDPSLVLEPEEERSSNPETDPRLRRVPKDLIRPTDPKHTGGDLEDVGESGGNP